MSLLWLFHYKRENLSYSWARGWIVSITIHNTLRNTHLTTTEVLNISPLHLLLYTGAMTQDLVVDQQSMQIDQCSTTHTEATQWQSGHHQGCNIKCLTSFLYSKWKFLYLLLSACHSFLTHSPLKKVLNKIEDSYQTYINTYKTHTMASHHRGTGQPS